jgi:hypothetical protein
MPHEFQTEEDKLRAKFAGLEDSAIASGADPSDIANIRGSEDLISEVTPGPEPIVVSVDVPVGSEFNADLTPSNVAPEQEQQPTPEQTFGDKTIDEYWQQLNGDFSDRELPGKEEVPGALVQLGAAITAFSPTKALYDEFASPVFAPDRSFNFYDHFEEIKETIHPDHWETLASARSKPELDLKIQKLADERFAMETIFKGNKVVGGAAVIGAILGDPTTLLAGAGEFAILTKLASNSRKINALTGAAVLGGSSAAQEAIIANARESVTADDVIDGALIGMTLGGGIGAMFKAPRLADLNESIRRVSEETRNTRKGMDYGTDSSDSPGAGVVATGDDLPPRRMERVVSSDVEDTVATGGAIRQHIAELRTRAKAFSSTKQEKSGLRTAKKSLQSAQTRLDAIGLGQPGARAARREVTAAEKQVDGILQAQQSSKEAAAAAAELAAFKRLGRTGQVNKLFGEAGAPRRIKSTVRETDESKQLREAHRAQRATEDGAGTPADTAQPTGGGSVGAARVDTQETPVETTLAQNDIIDQAEEWVAHNEDALVERLNSKTGIAIEAMSKAGITMDSTFFIKAKSAVAKHFGSIILENGAGLGGREKTAAILKDFYERRILSAVMPQYRASYNAWAHAQGVSRFNLKQYYGSGKTQFDGLLRRELESRRLRKSDAAITNDQSIKDAADGWQKGMDEALDAMKTAGVRGAEDIDRIPGYVPLKWTGAKIRRLSDSDRLAYQSMLGQNYARTLGIDLEDANVMAHAVFQRAMKKELQLDANPAALLTGDARAELRSMFEDAGLNPGRLNALLERIDGSVADRGKFKNLRSRNEVDLTQTAAGRSLMDIVDNNMDVIVGRYASETAGRSALARKGITSDADWDTMKRTLVQDMTAKDPNVKVADINKRVDAVHSQLLGRPVGEGVNRNMRRLMDLATLSMLGQVGFAQLAELGTITGQLGMRTMIEEIPSMGRFLRSARRGDVEPDVIDEIETMVGTIGDEHLLFRPEVRLEDAAGDDPTWLKIIDKGLAGGQDMLGYASGMNHIKRLEQRLATKVMADKVANLAMGRDVGRLTVDRLADVGWDEATLKRITAEIRKHAEFDGTKLKRLNMEKWAPNVTEDFAIGLNRFTHQVVQRPLAGETAHWMHSTLGAMFTQFRHFPLVAMEKQLARNTMHGDMTTFMTVTYGLAWSGMAYIAKSVANAPGQEDGFLEERLTAERIGKGAVQYSGMAAMLPDGISVLAYAGLIPADWAFNAGRTGGHKQSKLSMQTIPALGAAEDVFNTLTTPTRALWDDYEIGKKDVSALQGATVLGNTLPANIIFGLMKQAAE